MAESRTGLFKVLRNFSSRKAPENPYRINERANIDIDYYNDMILKLKEEIKAKNKEIQILKVSKTKREEDYQRTMRVLQEIINKSDNATVKGMQLIDQNFKNQKRKNKSLSNANLEDNNDNLSKKDNISGISHPSSSNKNKSINNEQLPQIENILNISKNHKRKIKEMVYINLLKQEIDKKNEKIESLTKNFKNNEEMKNNFFIKSYEQVKKENELILYANSEMSKYCEEMKMKNNQLSKNFKSFQDRYKEFKRTQLKKTHELEEKVHLIEDEQKTCKLFHVKTHKKKS